MITLSGLGEIEDQGEREQIAALAKEHGVAFYPTYYDHELKGDANAIEIMTKELWGMSRTEWAENALIETHECEWCGHDTSTHINCSTQCDECRFENTKV